MPTKILIVFYSRNGSVEALAKAMADGAMGEGAEVRIRRARELVAPEVMAMAPGWAESAARMNALYEAPTAEDAEWADAILFGSPTRFGGAASELRAWLETLGALWYFGKLVGKAGGAFTSTANAHGGNETTILSLYSAMAHLGLIIVPTGYGDPSLFGAGTPYGASSVSTAANNPPSDQSLTVAAYQGRRTAQVAAALAAVRA
ncbi:MAG: NAD(P)H:quinone oxidoreductase [Pseudomonadota bacterium]